MKIRICKDTSPIPDPFFLLYEVNDGIWKYVKKYSGKGLYSPVRFTNTDLAKDYINLIKLRGGLQENGCILPGDNNVIIISEEVI